MTDRPDAPASADVALDDAPLGDVVGRDVLSARAQHLEQTLLGLGAVTPADLEPLRPGGAGNPDTSATGVLAFLCALHRLHATKGAEAARGATAARWDAQAIADARAALAADPVEVPTSQGSRYVYPKAEVALNRIAYLDRVMLYLAARRAALYDADPTPESLAALDLVVETEARVVGQFAAIIADPAPGLPPEAETSFDFDPPAWTLDLDSVDLTSLRAAFLEANVLRINTIAERTRAMAKADADGAMPLAAFLGVMANDLGVQPATMLRKWTVGEAFAQALLKWEATEKAHAEAEKARDAEKARRA